MTHITPRAIYRIGLWIVLLSLGGCRSEPDPKTQMDALCAAVQVPPPESASNDVKAAHATALAICAARSALEKDGGG